MIKSRKLFLMLIKFMPVIQMAGMLFNNILYYFDITTFSYILDYLVGNSIITTVMLVFCSYVFKFCIWHRLIITANIINVTIANIDILFNIPISDLNLLILYHSIAVFFIAVSAYAHILKID